MRLTEALRDRCAEDWAAATDHAFCAELAANTLPEEKMRWYLIQDHKFLEEFVRLLATALAHAPTLEDAIPAAQFLALITGTENTYFERSFEALGVDASDRAAAPASETAALLEIMAAARRSGRYAEMLAVLCVAEWSYLEWGERHASAASGLPFWFREWIELHSGEGFRGVVEYLRTQLDRAWDDLDTEDRARVEDVFGETVRLERKFFDAAYASGV
ncbi:TenA family protein [uncultured Jannaschia sp.]|uniref:TenA family protein n=1 Tax=uncultured Jannaschia sp. TaxID=293347 RepID=UPI00260D910C|nr:TenA family protein [uncultured Jannaschia sp.]